MDPFDNIVTEDSRYFWDALRDQRLVLRRCQDCGYLRPPPGNRGGMPAPWLCPECLSEAFVEEEVSGAGYVETFVWYMVYVDSFSGLYADFRLPLPYNVSVIKLDAGPRVISNVVDVEMEALKISDRVRPTFTPVGSRSILRFAPAPK